MTNTSANTAIEDGSADAAIEDGTADAKIKSRSADATIKGYFYQFDHTIIQALRAESMSDVITVEGIEDVDLTAGDSNIFIQCKYYENSEYNHSVIKDAVSQMLAHFAGKVNKQKTESKELIPSRYRIYGHYKKGQEKLPSDFDVEFMKENFLTSKIKKVKHEIHVELNVGDCDLAIFRKNLEINNNALSYDEQQRDVVKLLKDSIPGCEHDDAELFYYPNAINVIQALAIKRDPDNRKITKEEFIRQVNRKDVVLNLWLLKKFGEDRYARFIKKKYFNFSLSTKVPKSTRIFALDAKLEFDVDGLVRLLDRISRRFSHAKNKSTLESDRFYPYILLTGISSDELSSVKRRLFKEGFDLIDGHPFKGSEFYAEELVKMPAKNSSSEQALKFIEYPSQVAEVAGAVGRTNIEIFDFFKSEPIILTDIPGHVHHHKIKTESFQLIEKAIL